jgi:hypothetical protein
MYETMTDQKSQASAKSNGDNDLSFSRDGIGKLIDALCISPAILGLV